MSQDSYQRIWKVISEIPYGKVATYGQIARLAGLGRRARLVGYALHSSPEHLHLPWHRVINSQGRISFPPDGENYRRQKDRLAREQIVLINGRVDLKVYRWEPGTEEWPEEYLHPERFPSE